MNPVKEYEPIVFLTPIKLCVKANMLFLHRDGCHLQLCLAKLNKEPSEHLGGRAG